jgi:hypothetical protein
MRLTVALALAVSALASTSTLASSSFPGALRSHLEASASPACTVCHETNAGGFATIDKPFGTAMQDAGLAAGDDGSLVDALDALKADALDSDGDGFGDIDELVVGADPNDEASTPDNSGGGGDGGGDEPLSYGFCGAAPLPIFVALGALLARRRRR